MKSKERVEEKGKDTLELYTRAMMDVPTDIKDFITNEPLMEAVTITGKAAASKGGIYICSIGEKIKPQAANIHAGVVRVDKTASYIDFFKSKKTFEEIYNSIKDGKFRDKNLVIFGGPDCEYSRKPEKIKALMKRGITDMVKELREDGIEDGVIRAILPRNIIYLEYGIENDEKTYLEKVSLCPFDGIPRSAFKKRPGYLQADSTS